MYTVDEIIGIVSRDKAFYGTKGGITLSGGEPLLFPDFTLTLLKSAREAEMTADIETCGCVDRSIFEKIAPYTNLLLYDIKDTDETRHKKYTGVFPEQIHKNLHYADTLGIKTLLRCIMVKGVNMDDGHYEGIINLFSKLKNCAGVELLPYHVYGSSKREQLGLTAEAHREWIPSSEDITHAKNKLKNIIRNN
jgi:pyruvate formate lyase activating enzyme